MELDLSEAKLPDEAKKLILEQLYYVDAQIVKGRFEGGKLSVELITGSTDESIRQKILAMCDETARTFKRVEQPIYFETDAAGSLSSDPTPELIATKQIVETCPGAFVYSGNFRRLIHALSNTVLDFGRSMGAEEQDYPATVPLSSLVRNGYLASFPQHAFFVSAAHTTLENLEQITQLTKKPDAEWRSSVGEATQVLAPTVCYHCFEALRGGSIPTNGRLFTAVNKCFRHEYKTARGLERLQTFTMREIISFGSQEQVANHLQSILDFTKKMVVDWGLQVRIIGATDPFFAVEAAKKRAFQSFLGLKQELQVYLPHNDKWLAVGSFNSHRDTLVKNYAVGSASAEPLNSGCVGYGLERLALGILSQQGTNSNKWSPALQKVLLRADGG